MSSNEIDETLVAYFKQMLDEEITRYDMKITTILKDIFLALASTLLFGGGIGFLGVWIFDAKISTMLHVSVYIFLLMLAMWLFIDYEEMKSRQSIQQAIREEEEKQQRMNPTTSPSS